MRFVRDRRGQSVVVGTVILFGFLILALSIYQVQFVPAENSEIEFEHSQEVEGEFNDLRNAILRTGSTGVSQSQRVQLGTRYPQRTFFVNPPPVTGEIRTTEERTLEINNATIGDGAPENAKLFWNDTDQSFNTSSIQYQARYSEFQDGPRLTYEHSIVAAQFRNDAILFRSDQTVVRDNRIALTMLAGELSASGIEPQTVELEATSRGARTVPIVANERTEIILPTATGNTVRVAEQWDETLRGANAIPDGDNVRIELEDGKEYRLRLSEVAVDGSENADAEYLVRVGPENVPSNVDVGIEARDKYNNPVADQRVNFSFAGTQIDGALTDDDGRVFFSTDGTGDYTATIDDNTEPYESVSFTVVESDAGGGGEGGDGGGGGAGDSTSVKDGGTVGGTGNSRIEFTVENRRANDIEIEEIRIESTTNGDAEFVEGITDDTFKETGGDAFTKKRIDIGGIAVELDEDEIELGSGTEKTVQLGEFRNGPGNGNRVNMNGEEVTITFFFDGGGSDTITIET